MAELLFRVGPGGRVRNLNVIDDFLAAGILLRDAECFFVVLRRVGTAGQFDALVSRVYANT